ncbi:ferritin-like domain-containing protein [Paenibacillus sp. L3-i20]|uniref:ferritin-like domain-containing protein n=1 Tax=Paenibacillus sp. L3-i20 TaxID=2905833 RepID=UPI001EDF71CE|nr:ferritin-like domain-containing protein [Paenibacillus sp. L3-i20]
MQYYTRQPSTNIKIVADLTKALNGEFHAIHCYEQLSNQAPTQEIKNRILEIRNDEIRHYHLISRIYTYLTDMTHSPQLTGQCAANFRSGVLASFKDEQETVDFYHKIARETNDAFIRETFQQAASDEQNHAVWFLYCLNHQ